MRKIAFLLILASGFASGARAQAPQIAIPDPTLTPGTPRISPEQLNSIFNAALAATYNRETTDFAWVNVKDAPYGAQGDTLSYTASAISAGSCLLSVPAANFSTASVGKQFVLHGASANAAPLTGTITGVTDSTHITLSACPTNTLPWSGSWSATVATSQGGSGSYAIGDTLTAVLSSGTGVISSPVFAVATVQAASAAVVASGSGGTAGSCTVTGTTGAGRLFQAAGTVVSGGLSGALSVSIGGNYSVAPTNLAAEPVTGCGLTGATVSLNMGPFSFTSVSGGQFSTAGSNPVATTTSGSGTGATINLSSYVLGGGFAYGTDDTAAVTSAITSANATGKTVYFPAGTYWLASQTTPITLNGETLVGDGMIASGSTSATNGSSVWISNATTPAFNLGYGVNWRGLAVNYPLQDNSQATPPAYPPLFSADATTGAVNDVFEDFVFVNPYVLFQTSGSGGAGRVFFRTGRAYCVSICFNMLDGMADTLQVENDTYWSIGADPNGNYGPKNLVNYTQANGTWFLANLSGTYPTLDGMSLHPHIVHQYRYGVRALAGTLNGMALDVDAWDGTITPLSVEGTASGLVAFTTRVWAYSHEPTLLTNNPVINCSSTSGNVRLTVTGSDFDYSLGSIISNQTGNCFSLLNVTGNTFHNWGQSQTPGAYSAIALNASSAADVTIVGNTFQAPNQVAGSYYHPIAIGNAGASTTISGNSFDGGFEAIWDTAPAPALQLTGNVATGMTGPATLRVTGTDTAPPMSQGNSWDTPLGTAATANVGVSGGVAAYNDPRFSAGGGGVTSNIATSLSPAPALTVGAQSYYLNNSTQNTNALRAKLGALRSAMTVANGTSAGSMRLAIIGDSTTDGYIFGGGASSDYYMTSPYHVMTTWLRKAGWPAQDNAIFGIGGNSTIYPLINDKRFSAVNAVTIVQSPTYGGNPVSLNGATTSTFSYTPIYPVDTFKVWYETATSNGSCSFQINGGTATTVNTAGSLSVQSVTLTSGAAPAVDTIKAAWASGGACEILGIEPWNSTMAELRILPGAWSGSSSVTWNNSAVAYSPINMIGALAPDATIIALGAINDWGAATPTPISTYTSNIQAISNAALASGPIIYKAEVPSAITTTPRATQTPYIAALYGLALTNNVPMIDTFDRWGTYEIQSAMNPSMYSAAVHDSAAGYADDGYFMAEFLNTL